MEYQKMISKEQLEKYKKIYQKNFGIDLSDQEALEQAIKLVRLVELVYKPTFKDVGK